MTALTPSAIDAMPAGPEMDARVAALVMRLDEVKTYPDGRVRYRRVEDVGSAVITTVHPVPPYSRSDAASLEVFKKLVTLNPDTDRRVDALYYWPRSNEWDDVLNKWKPGETWEVCRIGYDGTENGTDAPTLALAICRAALKAVGK